MNIFYLDESAKNAAHYHNDKHVRKMILEYAQLLSTAHRVLDGEQYQDSSKTGRKVKRWRLSDDREESLYQATHINHPCSVWTRKSKNNYYWLYNLFVEVCNEFEYRWSKQHATRLRLESVLQSAPRNIPNEGFMNPPQAMDEEYKMIDPVSAYRKYYKQGKIHLAVWTKREKPSWYD